jgi:hypothetical protein
MAMVVRALCVLALLLAATAAAAARWPDRNGLTLAEYHARALAAAQVVAPTMPFVEVEMRPEDIGMTPDAWLGLSREQRNAKARAAIWGRAKAMGLAKGTNPTRVAAGLEDVFHEVEVLGFPRRFTVYVLDSADHHDRHGFYHVNGNDGGTVAYQRVIDGWARRMQTRGLGAKPFKPPLGGFPGAKSIIIAAALLAGGSQAPAAWGGVARALPGGSRAVAMGEAAPLLELPAPARTSSVSAGVEGVASAETGLAGAIERYATPVGWSKGDAILSETGEIISRYNGRKWVAVRPGPSIGGTFVRGVGRLARGTFGALMLFEPIIDPMFKNPNWSWERQMKHELLSILGLPFTNAIDWAVSKVLGPNWNERPAPPRTSPGVRIWYDDDGNRHVDVL